MRSGFGLNGKVLQVFVYLELNRSIVIFFCADVIAP